MDYICVALSTLLLAVPGRDPRLDRLPPALRADGQALLEQADESRRAAQADRLARTDPAGAMRFLLGVLERDTSAAVRRSIVNRLGRHSDPAVRQALRRVGSSDPDVGIAILALERLRSQQTATVRGLLEERLAAAQAAGDAGQADRLVRELERWGPLVRGTMLPAFMQTPPPVFSVPAPALPLRVLAFGDYGSGSSDQKRVAGAITQYHRQHPFAFAATVGDNFLDQGVTGLTDPRWKTDWEDLYTPLGIPFFGTLGNHDWGFAGSPAAQVAYTLVSPSWRMPAAYYTFTAGPAQFFALETNDLSDAQLVWLKDQLERSTATWRIVYGHHPIYSAGTHGDTPDLVRRLLPVLRGRAQVYLAGHDHDFQHLKPEGGVSFFVSGTGGVSVRPPRPDPRSLFAQAVYGFAVMEIDTDHLNVEFLDSDLKLLYEHSVAR